MARVFSGLLTLCCISVISVSFVHAGIKSTFNYGFETGDLTDWVKTGNAFDFNPHGEITQQHGIVVNLRNIKGIGGSAPMKNTRGRLKGKGKRLVARRAMDLPGL